MNTELKIMSLALTSISLFFFLVTEYWIWCSNVPGSATFALNLGFCFPLLSTIFSRYLNFSTYFSSHPLTCVHCASFFERMSFSIFAALIFILAVQYLAVNLSSALISLATTSNLPAHSNLVHKNYEQERWQYIPSLLESNTHVERFWLSTIYLNTHLNSCYRLS